MPIIIASDSEIAAIVGVVNNENINDLLINELPSYNDLRIQVLTTKIGGAHLRPLIITFFAIVFLSSQAFAEKLEVSSILQVNAFGVCKKVSNSTGTSYFIPTGTATDWQSFNNFLPTGVTTASCVNYSWSPVLWGACTGGTGTWWESGFGACTGGTTAWGAWGECSAACTQTRSCNWNTNSGTQNQSISCNFTANSGSQTGTTFCQDDFGVAVPDSNCSTPKPALIQACTPNNTALCGAAPAENKACTPGGAAACAGDASQVCTGGACVPAEPCPGYNACNVAAVCVPYYDSTFGDAPQGCTAPSAKYCLNGVAVYDYQFVDDCNGAYYPVIGQACN